MNTSICGIGACQNKLWHGRPARDEVSTQSGSDRRSEVSSGSDSDRRDEVSTGER